MDPWTPYRPKDERLRLALLKERKAYRDFWDAHGRTFLEAWQAGDRERITAFRSGLWSFGIRFDGGIRGTKAAQFVELLDPYNKDVPDLPFPVFRDPAPVAVVECPGIPEEHRLTVGVNELKPSERLLKVDLARPRGELLEEFKVFLDTVDLCRKSEDIPEDWKENYSAWDQDKSRLRREAWQALEVWKLRREKKSFPEIAQKLEIGVSAAKQAFYRAFELIEGEPYQTEYFSQYQTISKQDLKRTCEVCPERAICTTPCPDVLAYILQDQVKSKHPLI